ncbi:hypothetical protein DNTS_021625 [Danionella cerebrum]|uniref:Hematopoietic cell signal transducer n=1 Tax=Danionella cerebrum TaxID=2873325 RepID=A0A553QXR8_9TELE|nr:hypothetical protein DNTS_021625 [Danionella translucida]
MIPFGTGLFSGSVVIDIENVSLRRSSLVVEETGRKWFLQVHVSSTILCSDEPLPFTDHAGDWKWQSKAFCWFFCLCWVVVVGAVEERSLCFGISSAAVAGIIFADVAVTMLIVTTTYWCASKSRQKKRNADEVYMNVRANLKA